MIKALRPFMVVVAVAWAVSAALLFVVHVAFWYAVAVTFAIQITYVVARVLEIRRDDEEGL